MDYPSPQELVVEVLTGPRPDVKIFKLRGPLTIHSYQEFQTRTRQEPLPSVTLVDLTEVPYIDSAALGTFVGIHVSCEGTDRKYALVGANDRLKGLFEMSHVNAFLVIYDSMPEAERNLLL